MHEEDDGEKTDDGLLPTTISSTALYVLRISPPSSVRSTTPTARHGQGPRSLMVLEISSLHTGQRGRVPAPPLLTASASRAATHPAQRQTCPGRAQRGGRQVARATQIYSESSGKSTNDQVFKARVCADIQINTETKAVHKRRPRCCNM